MATRESKITGVHISEVGSRLTITIPSKKSTAWISFMILWLLAWLISVFAIAIKLLAPSSSGQHEAILILFCALWLLVGAIGGSTLLWLLKGIETITISASKLTIVRSAGRLRWSDTFRSELVENLGLSERIERNWGPGLPAGLWGLTDRRISFKYKGEERGFGSGISVEEARMILHLVEKYVIVGSPQPDQC